MPNNLKQHLLIPFSDTTMQQKLKQDFTAYHLQDDIASTMNESELRSNENERFSVEIRICFLLQSTTASRLHQNHAVHDMPNCTTLAHDAITTISSEKSPTWSH